MVLTFIDNTTQFPPEPSERRKIRVHAAKYGRRARAQTHQHRHCVHRPLEDKTPDDRVPEQANPTEPQAKRQASYDSTTWPEERPHGYSTGRERHPRARQIDDSRQERASFATMTRAFSTATVCAKNSNNLSLRPAPTSSTISAEISHWYFFATDNHSKSLSLARYYWCTSIFDFATSSDLFLVVIGLYAMRKRMQVTGDRTPYLAWKGRLIHRLREKITAKRPFSKRESATMVAAAATLAYSDVQDKDAATARVHLRSLRSLLTESLPLMSAEEWRMLAWSDTGYALYSGEGPILPYWIHPVYAEESLSTCMSSMDTFQIEELLPTCRNFQTTEGINLFSRLFRLYELHSTNRTTSEPPFGLIYDLMYHLQHTRKHLSAIPSAERVHVDLLLDAFQIAFWAVSRLWSPLRYDVATAFLQKAFRRLCSVTTTRLMQTWDALRKLPCLLWIVATITAASLEETWSWALVVILKRVLWRNGIDEKEQLVANMKMWPWLEAWHDVRIDRAWRATLGCKEDPDGLDMRTVHTERGLDAGERRWLGVLEFWE